MEEANPRSRAQLEGGRRNAAPRAERIATTALVLATLLIAPGNVAARQAGTGPATPGPECRVSGATPEADGADRLAAPATEAELAMIAAAAEGDQRTVERVLAEGARVDARDGRGQTALIVASWRNDLPLACRLIAAGADVNAKDDTEQSAYLIATSEGYLDLLRATLAAGADVHSLDSFRGTGLIRAAERGHVAVVEELLATAIAVDHVNRLGLTALLEAIMFGDGGPRHTAVVRRLIEAGADPNLADGSGVTPLAHARNRGFAEIAAILEAAGGR